jgi:hypothetical protein
MNSSMNIRTLSASIARTSTRGRFESAAQLLALRRSDFLSQVDFSPPPVATSSPLSPAQLYASDLVVSVDFCAASVIGQFLRTYDPRIVAYHHLVASALVHTWSHASALPTPKTAAPRRTVLNSTLSSSPSAGGFFARIVIVASLSETEPLALQCVEEFRSSTSELLTNLRSQSFISSTPDLGTPLIPMRAPPTPSQLNDCEHWLTTNCDLLQNRLRFAFTANVSHDIMMHRAFKDAPTDWKEFRRNKAANKTNKKSATSPPEQR